MRAGQAHLSYSKGRERRKEKHGQGCLFLSSADAAISPTGSRAEVVPIYNTVIKPEGSSAVELFHRGLEGTSRIIYSECTFHIPSSCVNTKCSWGQSPSLNAQNP